MKKYLKSHKINRFKLSGPAQNEEFELPDGSYSVLNITDSFEYVIKKPFSDNPPIQIYIDKIINNNTFKIKTGYYLKFLTNGNYEITWKH